MLWPGTAAMWPGMPAAARTSAATAGERLPCGHASTVVTSGASVTGTATWSGHCHARLDAGMYERPLRIPGTPRPARGRLHRVKGDPGLVEQYSARVGERRPATVPVEEPDTEPVLQQADRA